MIGRKSGKTPEKVVEGPQGFDDFDLKLGDLMRGERATLGKSLLDVQRELRIKASYIAAIENSDPSVFDTPGFIAGYVRSYARYLGMDPEETFDIFCAESGFSTAHGMSDAASTIKKGDREASEKPVFRDPLLDTKAPFLPVKDSFMSRVEPAAIGSSLVLIALVAGIGYGGWSVLQEIQRVQVTPVEQTPTVLSELDPLVGAGTGSITTLDDQPSLQTADAGPSGAGVFTPPSSEAFDRLYRPEALDVPVLVARDAPISSLDPDSVGLFAQAPEQDLPAIQDSTLAAAALESGLAQTPSLFPAGADDVTVVAVRPAWLEIKDSTGSILLSRVLNAGEAFPVPANSLDPTITVGESGAVYFAVAGVPFGPAGERGAVTNDLSLKAEELTARYSPATAGADDALETVLADLNIAPEVPAGALAVASTPQVLENAKPGVTVIATADSWIEVTSPSGVKILAQVLKRGETYVVPQTDQAPTIFSGNAGGIFFAVEGKTFGPYGESGQFGRGLALAQADIKDAMPAANMAEHQELARVVAELNAAGQPLTTPSAGAVFDLDPNN